MIKIYFALNRREKKHDAAILAESHLYDSLERNAFSTTGEAMCMDVCFQSLVVALELQNCNVLQESCISPFLVNQN